MESLSPLHDFAALTAVLVYVALGGASDVVGHESTIPRAAQQDSIVLEGIVLGGGVAADGVTVLLHRVDLEGMGGQVDAVTVGPGGEFRFLLPALRDADTQDDVYIASAEYERVVYFGPMLTAAEQLDSVYVIRVFESEEVPLEGVPLTVRQRSVVIEFAGSDWFATDLFVIDNQGSRTLRAQEDGIVWSYPLPPGATEPVLADGGDLLPDRVTFEGGRVRVGGPLPPGGSGFMIRYRLEKLGSTIPAPGRTAEFQVWIEEPSLPLRVDGLEFLDVAAMGGSTFRVHGGSELVDAILTLVETDPQGPLPFEWAALLATVVLAAGGFLAYARPRRRVSAGQGTWAG